MADLAFQLKQCLRQSVCLVGVGNVDYGDDGLGLRLVEMTAARMKELHETSRRKGGLMRNDKIMIADNAPEQFLGEFCSGRFESIIFLDAVDFGGQPGEVVWLGSDEMTTQFPQISTHKISLGLLARLIEASSGTRVWLIGVQPQSLKAGAGISPEVQKTLEILRDVLVSALGDELVPLRQAEHGASSARLQSASKPMEAAC